VNRIEGKTNWDVLIEGVSDTCVWCDVCKGGWFKELVVSFTVRSEDAIKLGRVLRILIQMEEGVERLWDFMGVRIS
jgi:hypothetical protein